MNTKMIDILTRRAPREALLNIYLSNGNVFPSKVAKEVDVTYSHIVKLTLAMRKSGILTFEKRGRMKILKLTPKGTEIAKHLSELRTMLND